MSWSLIIGILSGCVEVYLLMKFFNLCDQVERLDKACTNVISRGGLKSLQEDDSE